MKRIADALELLTAQHDEISTLLTKRPLDALAIGELADLVTTHLAAEEQFLEILEVGTEHDELRLAVAEILAADMGSPRLAELVDEFATRWNAHTTSQEHVFEALAETITPAVLERIGLQLGEWAAHSHVLAA